MKKKISNWDSYSYCLASSVAAVAATPTAGEGGGWGQDLEGGKRRRGEIWEEEEEGGRVRF